MEPSELYSPEMLEHEVCRTVAMLCKNFSKKNSPFQSETFEEQLGSLELFCPESGDPLAQLLKALKASHVNLRNPHSTAHMVPNPANFSVLGDLIKSYLNQCSFIYEEAPIGRALETVVIDWFRETLGLSSNSAGQITSGGTSSNITALFLAREKIRATLPGIDHKHCIICTPESHLSVKKAARLSGLSERQIMRIPSSRDRQSDKAIADIETRIANDDFVPVMLISTIGTTGTGQLEEIEFHMMLAKKLNCWLHVDAAWGGQLALAAGSGQIRKYWQAANSISWDPHKTMFVSYPLGLLFVGKKKYLNPLLTASDYALRADQRNDDPGHLHLEGSRGLEVIKLWLGIRLLGRDGYQKLIDRLIETATTFYNFLIREKGIEVYGPPETSIVCFRFCPSNIPDSELNDLNQHIQNRSFATGQNSVSLCKVSGTSFLRIVITNPTTEFIHLEESLRVLKALCKEWTNARTSRIQHLEVVDV